MIRAERGLPFGTALLLASLILVLAAQSAAAFDFRSRHAGAFLGFWEGIDPLDGSTVQLSISDIDHDGKIEIIDGESFFTSCYDADHTEGRGKAIGMGTVLARTVLEAEVSFFCISDDTATTSDNGTATVQYILKSGGKVLLIKGTNQFPDIVTHRTSE